MKTIIATLCCLFSLSVLASEGQSECQKTCETAKTNALMGCYYMQQSCIRRFHRETDFEYCMQENLKCIDRADKAKEVCEVSCAEKGCETTCDSTGVYGMSQMGGLFHDRCYEIIDCAIRTWDENVGQCVVTRHDERRMTINCHDIPPM